MDIDIKSRKTCAVRFILLIPQPVFLISDLRVTLHILYINIRSAYELNIAPDTAGIAVLPVSGLTTWAVHGFDHMPFDLSYPFGLMHLIFLRHGNFHLICGNIFRCILRCTVPDDQKIIALPINAGCNIILKGVKHSFVKS